MYLCIWLEWLACTVWNMSRGNQSRTHHIDVKACTPLTIPWERSAEPLRVCHTMWLFPSVQSHVPRRDISRAYIRIWHDSSMCVTWLVHMRDMTHSCVSRDVTHSHVSMQITWLLCMCDMTHPYVTRHEFICVTCTCEHANHMTPLYVWNNLSIRVSWLVHTCHMTWLIY